MLEACVMAIQFPKAKFHLIALKRNRQRSGFAISQLAPIARRSIAGARLERDMNSSSRLLQQMRTPLGVGSLVLLHDQVRPKSPEPYKLPAPSATAMDSICGS